MPKKRFALYESGDSKELYVKDGPCNLDITIDYDDVDHEVVDREANMLIALLNKHWKPQPNADYP